MGTRVRKFAVALVGIGSLALLPATVGAVEDDGEMEVPPTESTETTESSTTTTTTTTTTIAPTTTVRHYPPPPPSSLPATGGGESAAPMLAFATLAIGLGLIATVAARRRTSG